MSKESQASTAMTAAVPPELPAGRHQGHADDGEGEPGDDRQHGPRCRHPRLSSGAGPWIAAL